jgi:rfaE bifunctional protein kinase chain/domain
MTRESINMLTDKKLDEILQHLPQLKIGLLGDLFLDRYLELVPGHHELSIETGLEAYQILRVRNSPGALGTVMNNLAALGVGRLIPVTVLGDDGHGYDLLHELKKLPTDLSHVITDSQRLTPTYTKPMRQDTSGTWQELNRLDVRSREPLTAGCTAKLIDQIRHVFSEADGLIVLDQINEPDCGVVNTSVRDTLRTLVASHPDKLVFVDSRRHLGKFQCGVLKGNRSEVFGAAELDQDSDEVLETALSKLSERTRQPAFCTAGERGIYVAQPNRPPQLIPGYPLSGPVDIVGAGDAATSGMVTALLSGAAPDEAATVGNLVASITVQQLGTTGTASAAQVRQRWAEVRI